MMSAFLRQENSKAPSETSRGKICQFGGGVHLSTPNIFSRTVPGWGRYYVDQEYLQRKIHKQDRRRGCNTSTKCILATQL